MTTGDEREYVLGSSDAEIDRLGLQHDIWRADAAAAWHAAGFRAGDTIIDVGCGPGFATLDLADLVGRDGEVVAVDQSPRFLEHLRAQCERRGVHNVTTRQRDLSTFAFDGVRADGAWLRWVLAFIPHPQRVLARVAAALEPGGRIAIHEYFAYETWKFLPRDPVFESFVAAVMASWRTRGGEPNVGLELIPWLEELGFEIEHTRTITEVVRPADRRWHWPAAFALAGLDRLIELGDVTFEEGNRMRERVATLVAAGSWMVTPAVVEVIAMRRA